MTRLYLRTRRFHWIIYVFLFGTFPIVLRLLSAQFAESQIPYILLSDVVFLGLMFNVATMLNVSSPGKIRPAVYTITFLFTFMTSLILALIYTQSMVGEVKMSAVWAITAVTVICTLVVSFLTTYTDMLDEIQEAFDDADLIEGLPLDLRKEVEDMLRKIIWDGDSSRHEALTHALRKYKLRKAQVEAERFLNNLLLTQDSTHVER